MTEPSLDGKSDPLGQQSAITDKDIPSQHTSSCREKDSSASTVSHEKNPNGSTGTDPSQDAFHAADRRIAELQDILQHCPVLRPPLAHWNPEYGINNTRDSVMHRSFFEMDPKSDSLQYMSLKRKDEVRQVVKDEYPIGPPESDEMVDMKRRKISLNEYNSAKQSKGN